MAAPIVSGESPMSSGEPLALWNTPEEKYRIFLAAISEVVMVMEADGRLLEVAPTSPSNLIRFSAEFIGQRLQDVVTANQAEALLSTVRYALELLVSVTREFRLQIGESLLWMQFTATPLTDRVAIVSARDITEQKETEFALEQAKDYAENLIQTANALIIGLDAAGQISVFNRQAERVTGYTRAELRGQSWFDVLVPGERYPNVKEEFESLILGGPPHNFEHPILTKTGEERYIVWQNNQVRESGQIIGTISFGIDITERKAAEDRLRTLAEELERRVIERTTELENANNKLRELATIDELTGLANRRKFNETLEAEIRRACRNNEHLSLLMADVDFFKRYNDSLGHSAGDECLRLVSETLRDVFRRAADLPCRFGGEEFAIILPNCPREPARLRAEVLREMLSRLGIPHPDSDVSEHVTISIGGASLNVTQSIQPAELVRLADEALYRAKSSGRNQVVFL